MNGATHNLDAAVSRAPELAIGDVPPLLVYDGDCGFCRRGIEDWRRRTRDRLPCAAYQDVADQFPEVTPEQFKQSVVLIEPDGNIRTGAAAILRSFSYLPRRGLGWWAYRHVPGFAWASEKVYRWVARNRNRLSRYIGEDTGAHNPCESCDCQKESER